MENNYNNGGLFPVLVDSQKVVQAEKPQNPFILGNTLEVSMQSLQEDYLVPVFSREKYKNAIALLKKGYSVRAVSKLENISHTTVQKLKNKFL